MSIRIRSEAILIALVLVCGTARAQDELDPYRDRFKSGLDRYQAGDYGEALRYWEPIYRELGKQRGYRLAFNLARAYEKLGDTTRAVEQYEDFLAEVDARRTRNESIDEIVTREAGEAKARLDELATTKARIRVLVTTPPVSVQVDAAEPRLAGFVAWVAPGTHVVTFAPRSPAEDKQELILVAGQIVEVVPSPAPPPIVAIQYPPPAPPLVPVHVPPFGAGWLVGFATATLVSFGFPIAAYANAVSVRNAYETQTTPDEVSAYDGARTLAYVSWIAPIALGITTVVLAIAYFSGQHTVLVRAPEAR